MLMAARFIHDDALEYVADRILLVSLMDYDQGILIMIKNRMIPVGHSQSALKVLPMWPVSTLENLVGREGFEPSTIGLKVGPQTA